MRLLFTSDLTGLGGGETGLAYLVEKLCEQHSCKVICGSEGPLVERLTSVGAQVEVIEYKKKLNLPRSLARLHHSIKRFSPDYMLSNDPMTACLVHMAAPQVRNSWICHGQWYCFSRFRKVAIRRSVSSILCVSDAARENLVEQGFIDCFTTYLGVPGSLFENAKPAGLRASFEVDEKDLLVGTIARFQTIKGQMKGVKAVEDAMARGLDVTYVLIGGSVFGSDVDDAYEESVKDYVRSSGLSSKIRFLGERRDIPSLLKDVDVLMIPSDNESLGVVAIEAIASGTPLVSTPNDGVREIVQDNPAFIARTNDSKGLADLLIRYKNPAYLTYAREELKAYREMFDINNVVDGYLRALEEGNR